MIFLLIMTSTPSAPSVVSGPMGVAIQLYVGKSILIVAWFIMTAKSFVSIATRTLIG